MPYCIEGWVEATTTPPSEQDQHSWMGILMLGGIVDVADCVSERLFGLSKRCAKDPSMISAIAPRRGIPANPSKELRADLQTHDASSGEVGGYTYITWEEMAPLRPDLDGLLGSDWLLVYDLVERLAEDYRFSPGRLRVTVWYNW